MSKSFLSAFQENSKVHFWPVLRMLHSFLKVKRVKINFVSIAWKMGETVFLWIFTGTNIKDYYLSFWVENHILIYFRRALSNIRIFSSLNVYIGVETSKLHIRKYLTLRPEIQGTVQCIQESAWVHLCKMSFICVYRIVFLKINIFIFITKQWVYAI